MNTWKYILFKNCILQINIKQTYNTIKSCVIIYDSIPINSVLFETNPKNTQFFFQLYNYLDERCCKISEINEFLLWRSISKTHQSLGGKTQNDKLIQSFFYNCNHRNKPICAFFFFFLQNFYFILHVSYKTNINLQRSSFLTTFMHHGIREPCFVLGNIKLRIQINRTLWQIYSLQTSSFSSFPSYHYHLMLAKQVYEYNVWEYCGIIWKLSFKCIQRTFS